MGVEASQSKRKWIGVVFHNDYCEERVFCREARTCATTEAARTWGPGESRNRKQNRELPLVLQKEETLSHPFPLALIGCKPVLFEGEIH